MTSVFEALGVERPDDSLARELSAIGLKHIMQQDYTRADEVLDVIKAHGYEPTTENKILVASSIAYGASIGEIGIKLNQVFQK